MRYFFHKCLLLVLTVFLLSVGVRAQTFRFIYIQTENKQPFYVKIDKRTFNSSASGYIILSKLVDSAHSLVIGFPGNEWPEYRVTIEASETNAGYLLKKVGEVNWDIYNLQTLNPLVLQKLAAVNNTEESFITGNEFARILSEVVNDPSITRVEAEKTNEPVTRSDPGKMIKTEVPVPENKVVPGKNMAEADKAGMVELKLDSTANAEQVTYVDLAKTEADTVKVLMPVNNEIIIEKEKESSKPVSAVKTDPGFIDMELKNPNQRTDSGTAVRDDLVITEKKPATDQQPVTRPAVIKNESGNDQMINSDCKKIATQDDFIGLRKKMAAKNNRKEMLNLATRQFLKTCFISEHIRDLGILFNNDEERYRFFVAAYPYVADTHNFGKLEDQLTDNYYKSRFKTMLSH